jgi:hypothetical protein
MITVEMQKPKRFVLCFGVSLEYRCDTVLISNALFVQAFAHYSNLTLDDDAIRPWLGGFVKDKGVEAATELLEGVGELRLFENTTEEEETGALSEDDVFSACLLVMDDNHVLIEWLAYHYHALPLRHLIVAVDPRSITSPSEILGRWRGHGMTIEEWTDKDFMSEQLYTVAQNMSELNKTDIIELHRARQREFYKECMKRHKKKGRKWTMLTDTDEFLLTNIMATKRFNVTDVPPIEEPGSIMKFLKQERAKNVTEMPKRTACIMIPRLRFGSRESEPEKVNFRVPAGFNASTFATLRHRKHAEKRLSMINKTGKVIVDVSRLHPGHMKVKNPHRPLWAYCPKSELYTQLKDNLLVIHHYAGTWEQYIFRDDYRAMKTKKVCHTCHTLLWLRRKSSLLLLVSQRILFCCIWLTPHTHTPHLFACRSLTPTIAGISMTIQFDLGSMALCKTRARK